MNLLLGPWDYLMGGTETETTLCRNRQSLDAIAFRPRVLRDVSNIDCATTLFGKKIKIPVVLAPIGGLETFDLGGGATAAKAAEEFGVPVMLSSVCQPGVEAIAAAAQASYRILQLYVRGDDAWVDDVVKQAIDHGYSVFAITVDTPYYSRRERDLARRFVKPWRVAATGFVPQASLNWDNIKRFKDKHKIPLILKGITTPEDAEMAVKLGVDGIYVSTHGGRQLDHARGAIEVLPEVVEAVNQQATILYDGAINRGTDVVKAMALGAHAVGIGRLQCFGLAAAGQAGLVRVLELLDEEIRTTLGLLGVTCWSELNKSYLQAVSPISPAHALSAFPLLDLDDEGY